jgi:hypothetical protein
MRKAILIGVPLAVLVLALSAIRDDRGIRAYQAELQAPATYVQMKGGFTNSYTDARGNIAKWDEPTRYVKVVENGKHNCFRLAAGRHYYLSTPTGPNGKMEWHAKKAGPGGALLCRA